MHATSGDFNANFTAAPGFRWIEEDRRRNAVCFGWLLIAFSIQHKKHHGPV
jgi:hypothetical protein